MNYLLLSKHLGVFSVILGLLMLPAALWAVYFREWLALVALGEAMAASVVFGGVLALIGWKAPQRLYQREALGLVGLAWILAAGLGALPFVFAGVLGPVDAYFESMSGFTTTGSSVFTRAHFLETPKSIMFWRSFTHWLGGMGIVVLFIAVLPYLGAGGKQLFKYEAPGPTKRALRPRIKDTASILYKIYLVFTVVETAALLAAGIGEGQDLGTRLYEALCQTFGTLATGGFSTRADSIGAFHSAAVEAIIIVFMVMAASNFALHFALFRGNWKAPFKDTEWRAFLAILALSVLAVTINLLGYEGKLEGELSRTVTTYESFGAALRYAAFQVVSIMTTTGYTTADFDVWPHFSRILLVTVMFVGGCAGSTGGGVKVVRVILLAKMAYRRLESTLRPKTVRAIRISGEVVDEQIQHTVYGFFVLYVAWFVLGSLIMAAHGLPFQTAVTSVAATLNNIGPGLEVVSPSMNYSLIAPSGKLFLSLCMVLGRLELFSILVLFVPAFWRSD